MKLVGHKCVGSAVTQSASYKPFYPLNLHVNPIRILVQTAYSENVKYVSMFLLLIFKKSKSKCYAKFLNFLLKGQIQKCGWGSLVDVGGSAPSYSV
jgi:hypothetical protein